MFKITLRTGPMVFDYNDKIFICGQKIVVADYNELRVSRIDVFKGEVWETIPASIVKAAMESPLTSWAVEHANP